MTIARTFKRTAAAAMTVAVISATLVSGMTDAEAGKRHRRAAAAGAAAFAAGLAIGTAATVGGYYAPHVGPRCVIRKRVRFNRWGHRVVVRRRVCY